MKKLEHVLKRAAFGVARRTLGTRPRLLEDGPAIRAADLCRVKRVVVVRQDRRLGNLVMVTSLAQGLRQVLPAARIDLVAPRALAEVLSSADCLDRVIPVDHRGAIRAPWRLATLRRALRKPDLADVAIDASPPHHFSFLSGATCALSGAPTRLGYARGEAGAFLNCLLPAPTTFQQPEHHMLHALLRGVVAEPGPPPLPRLVVRDTERALARRAFDRWGFRGRPVVAIHPGARAPKRWPTEHFEEAAGRLEAAGCGVIVFSGPAERGLLDCLCAPGPRRIYAPPLGLRGLMALVEPCAAFLSADCGPMHLAAALGVRCVTPFRIENFARYGPAGTGHRVLYADGAPVDPLAAADAVLEVVAGVPTR